MNCNVNADFPTPPDPTIITLCKELDAPPFLFDILLVSVSFIFSTRVYFFTSLNLGSLDIWTCDHLNDLSRIFWFFAYACNLWIHWAKYAIMEFLSNIAVVKLNLVLTWVCLYFSWIKFLFKNLRPPFSMITNKRINSKKLVTRKYVKLVSKPLLKSKMCDVFLGIDDHRSWANKSLQIMFFFERFLNVFSILRQCTVSNVLSTICQICYNSFVPFIR